MIQKSRSSIDELVRRSSRAAEAMAEDLFRSGRRGSAARMFFSALHRFIQAYFIRLGFRDGADGLNRAALSAGAEAEKRARLWELTKRESGDIASARPGARPVAAAGRPEPEHREPISAVVVCMNREGEIEQCLQSLRWAEELVVVDSFSTDRTPEIARRYADKFFQREYASIGDQRNWALEQTSHRWILMIDSDEMVPGDLRDEIREALRNPRAQRYAVYRRNFFLGREMKHGGWNTDRMTILFRKDRYRYPVGAPHVRPVPEEKGGVLSRRLIHHSHRSIGEFVMKSNHYATGMAQEYFRRGKRGPPRALFGHALYNFFKVYLLRLGFLDGAHGLVSATLSSYYVAEKWAKLGELHQERRSV